MNLGEIQIDMHQLPIPDWDLPCPRCRYCLNGLPSHRCPECGLEFDMADIVGPWHKLREPRFRGDELPFPDFGLQCGACNAPLAGAATHACPRCGTAFDPRGFVPEKDWFLIYPPRSRLALLPVIRSLLVAEWVPHCADDRHPASDMPFASAALAGFIMVSTEFFFEYRWLLRQSKLDLEHAQHEPRRGRWTCPSCGQKVPANFDSCWNCEALRPEM